MKMVMKRRTTVLLMLSLIVLVGTIAADGVDDQAIIRLPSDGDGKGKGVADDAVVAEAAASHGGDEEERPWDCCDHAPCKESFPPICWCTDVVEKCAAACKDCKEAPSSPGRYVCRDTYKGWPGPTCTGTS